MPAMRNRKRDGWGRVAGAALGDAVGVRTEMGVGGNHGRKSSGEGEKLLLTWVRLGSERRVEERMRDESEGETLGRWTTEPIVLFR